VLHFDVDGTVALPRADLVSAAADLVPVGVDTALMEKFGTVSSQ
jgi:hypothetical protein